MRRVLTFSWCILGILAAGGIFGCSGKGDRPLHLLLRHNAPPEQPQHRALLRVAELLAERSKGRIRLEVHALVGVPNQIENLRRGSREIAMAGMTGLAEYYGPMAALEAPYMFRDLDHFYHTVESPFGQRLIEEFQRRSGLRILAVWHQGVRQVTLRDRPATTPMEFSRIKLRVPPAPMFVEAAHVLGALPTTMPFSDVYGALRAGAVDGQENPLPTIKAAHFNEVCTYLVLTNHMIGTIVPVIGERYWNRIAPKDRRLILDAFRDGGRYNRRIIEDEERRLVDEFARGGMTVLRPNLAVFRERAKRSWRRYSDVWGDSLVAEIQAVK